MQDVSGQCQALTDKGFKKIKSGDLKGAYKLFTKAITEYPDSAIAYYGLGLLDSFYTHDTLKAISDYNMATKLDVSFSQAFKERAGIKVKQHDYMGALFDCNQAIAADPNNAKAYNIRGLSYKGLNKYIEAEKDYSSAIKMRSTYAEAYMNRAIVEQENNQYTKALSDLCRSTELQPLYKNIYINDVSMNRHLYTINDTIRIQMIKINSMYYLPVSINGVREEFMLDFGCTSLIIPRQVLDSLEKKGTLDDHGDFLTDVTSTDVSNVNTTTSAYKLNTLRIGNQLIFDIPVRVVDSKNAPLLLGELIFRRYDKIIINNKTSVLTLIRNTQ
jgi:tetratricopeptide (TPR) repeat protein